MALIINIVNEEIQNLINGSQPRIEITRHEMDLRGRQNEPIRYNVSYEIDINGETMEISGVLNPHHTGRAVDYGFEPGYFTDSNSESYWDANWETIEDAIRDKFYSQKY